ncbi:MAG: hypothetical protein ABI614_12170 [Planctomycetota bacterium]
MNQLGKNLVLTLCVVATLLIILGLRRNFGGGASSLLSQPSGEFEPAPTTAKNSPRPRVLQAMPVTQHDREVLSPTGPQYLGSEFAPSRASDFPISPIPSASPGSSPRSLDAPTLVPVATQLTSPVTDGVELPKATPAAPSATRPSLPEIVLTEADDSFWTISERVYGSGVYYRALFRHNEAKVLRPDQLRAGVEVSTPPLEVLRERYPADFPAEPATTK